MKALFLDIDGTLTNSAHHLDPEIARSLEAFYKEGWQFVFVTGRSFLWSFSILKNLNFPFWLAIENGSLILEMPSKKIVSQTCIPTMLLNNLQPQIFERAAIYSGYLHQDFCYYFENLFDSNLLGYALNRAAKIGESWISLKRISDLPINTFAALKVFGEKEILEPWQRQLLDFGLKAPLIKDPLGSKTAFIILATVTDKGNVIDFFKKNYSVSSAIAAGDDNNDLALFENADLAIAMPNAPPDLLKRANIISEPIENLGLIKALKQAIHEVENS